MLLDDNDLALLSWRFKCLVMKMGSVIVENQDLETHLNLIKDFTGSRVSMSITMSCGRRSDDKFLSLDIIDNDDSKGNAIQ